MPKKIEYGSKSLKLSQTNIGRKPLFLLVKESGDLEEKCFCSECQSLFDWVPQNDQNKRIDRYGGSSVLRRTLTEENISCPDCGNNSGIGCVRAQETEQSIGHIKTKGSYRIPDVITGRYLFSFENENGETTRVDDNLMMRSTIVYPSGKMFHSEIEYSHTNDLIKNSEYMTKTRINGNKREELNVKDDVDTFTYMPVQKSFSVMTAYNANVAHIAGEMMGGYLSMFNPIVAAEILPKRGSSYGLFRRPLIDEANPSEIYYSDTETMDVSSAFLHDGMHDYRITDEIRDILKQPSLEMQSMKTSMVASRFKVDPVYVDFYNNGMFLTEHHPGSNEGNTEIDEQKRLLYTFMMTKYPVAFEYACERADFQVTNWTMNEKRRAEANPDYTAKPIPDSVKAKYIRQEINFVCEQLAVIDDKILRTIADSKDIADMKQKLQFFAFGQNEKMANTQVPKNIRLKDETTMQDPVDATKKLKSAFNMNPIGVANTVYTCKKLGISDINHVNTVIGIANESPGLEPVRHRRNGQYYYQQPKFESHRHAMTVTPIRDSTMLRFLKNYGNTHSTTDLIDSVYGSEDNWGRMAENVRIYSSILKHADIASSHDDIENTNWELEKSRLANYLKSKSIKDAYVDYIGMYGDKTPKKVNQLAYQIKYDKALIAMKSVFDSQGIEGLRENEKFAEILDKFPPYCDKSDDAKASFANDPDAYITTFFSKYKPTKVRETVVPQNGKSLFNNRSMNELHDELSHMAKNCKYPNTELTYSASDKALEASYEATDGSGVWEFCLHEDTNEMIRTATELSNCLASHQDYAINGRHKYLFMRNELGEKVACISLYPRGGRYEVGEFQGPHDNAVEGRYKDIIMQWLDEHEIHYEGNSNVAAIGTNRSFYGGHDADYHHDEVDEVTGSVVSIAENQARAKQRHEQAVNMYGLNDAGEINLPDVPEELSEFN